MKKFIEEHELEALLIVITMLGIARWWIPDLRGFEKMYAASQWVLSYDHGLIRRGLVGAIVELWIPIVTVENIHRIATIAFYTFLVLLLVVFSLLLARREKSGQLSRLILIFVVNPATIALLARSLGSFDLFLTMIMLLSMTLLSLKRFVWLIPILMIMAMFIHEGFLILYAPTLVAAMLFDYRSGERKKAILATLGLSVISVLAIFLVLYLYGTPAVGYQEFARLIQLRATFHVTPLSTHECYFSIKDHYVFASSSLYDAGSIANVFLALVILSPTILILFNLWSHAFRNCGAQRAACWLFVLAPLSGLLVVPIATDYGRWFSAVMFSNFFSIFFLVNRGIINVEQLVEYDGGSFKPLFVGIVLTYLLFGPFHDWNPYPYREDLIVSSLFIVAVLLFDVAFVLRWRSLRSARYSER
jgi:hypothetical protein